jgi:hypothetical protein
MYDLLTRTISQGLQAFLPIAFSLTWFRRAGASDPVIGLKWGIVAALPATAGAAYWFQTSSYQARWEASLATAALALAIWFARRVWLGLPSARQTDVESRRQQAYRLAFALAAALIIARQTMEIALVSTAALQLRSLDALLAITSGVAVSLVVTGFWMTIGRRLPDSALCTATRVFAALFVGQVAMYAFHESAEARLLPWSDVLHAATEPYGPDGVYGRYVSGLLFVIPLAAAVVTLLKARVPPRIAADRQRRTMRVVQTAVGVAVLIAAGIGLMNVVTDDRAVSYASPYAPPSERDLTTIAASPHVLFRHTIVDRNYSRLSIAPLDVRQPADRAAAELTCERVSYAAGHGICLHADRGFFTTYSAVLFDRTFKPTHTIKIDGRPSRTRVSPDGRVAAITVFVAGESYVGSPFSTRTTILDMATGDVLGDLESFTTWRDGARFKSADFNFWGVTFARDSNVFYATLHTAGTTYLVRGDLGLRKLTVLRDNVECPSLSPNNRLIAFKKKVKSDLEPWRFYVLDLATLTDRPIAAETRSIDDQIEWLDDDHVLYGVRRSIHSSSLDVWVAPLDNSAPARVFMPEAESPIVVR